MWASLMGSVRLLPATQKYLGVHRYPIYVGKSADWLANTNPAQITLAIVMVDVYSPYPI